MSKDYLTPAEVAELLMVSPITVRQWAEKGWLAASTTPGGHRRFAREEVETFARQRNLRAKRSSTAATRILVVDDDLQLADFLLEWLDSALPGCKVEIARDGFEAGQKVLVFQPEAILLDLMMPGMDGFQVCARIKSDPATRHVRIFAMTGYPSPENVTRILAAGAEQCFAKPLDLAELRDALDPTRQTTATPEPSA